MFEEYPWASQVPQPPRRPRRVLILVTESARYGPVALYFGSSWGLQRSPGDFVYPNNFFCKSPLQLGLSIPVFNIFHRAKHPLWPPTSTQTALLVIVAMREWRLISGVPRKLDLAYLLPLVYAAGKERFRTERQASGSARSCAS